MKKEYEAPKAEKVDFNYAETVVRVSRENKCLGAVVQTADNAAL